MIVTDQNRGEGVMGAFGTGTAELSIDFGQISKSFPGAVVERILRETKRESVRHRKLPAYLMTYYVIAAGLMVSVSAREVLRPPPSRRLTWRRLAATGGWGSVPRARRGRDARATAGETPAVRLPSGGQQALEREGR